MATSDCVGRGGSYGGRIRKKRNPHSSLRLERESHSKTNPVNINDSSAIIQSFKCFQQELDSRNDCYERIVKLSRDITIESKRIIFLLHRATGSDDKNTILTEAAARMLELRLAKFFPLAKELDGQDPFQFLRAYSPGLQEYIEAVTFYHYLANKKLVNLDSIQAELTFAVESIQNTHHESVLNEKAANTTLSNVSPEAVAPSSVINPESECGQGDCDECLEPQQPSELPRCSDGLLAGDKIGAVCVDVKTVSVHVPPTEYLLGVADFTGELMKMAITSVGAGDLDTPIVVAEIMRAIHDGFAAFGNFPKDLRYKMRVLKQSLQKVENACYTMKVRGSEMPTHMLVDVFTGASSDACSTFQLDEPEEFYD